MPSFNWRRWLPSNKGLIAGVLTNAAVVGLHAAGVHVLPNELSPAIVSGVGFLIAAIVHTEPAPVVTPTPVKGDTVASLLASEIEHRLESEPALVQGLVSTALQMLATPAQPDQTVNVVASVQAAQTTVAHLPQT